jgi:HKD family nuclease
MPDPVLNASPLARAAVLGDYRRLNAKLPGVSVPAITIPSAGATSDIWVGRALPARALEREAPIAQKPTPSRGSVRAFFDWMTAKPGSVPQQPNAATATPINDAPSPPQAAPLPVGWVPPVSAPIAGLTPGETGIPGVQLFFTNTYAKNNAQNAATAQADPNNPDHQLIKLIDSVPTGGKLDGAFYDIGVSDVVEALVRAKQRGIDVRLVTDKTNVNDKSTGAVRAPIARLQSVGIPIIPNDTSGLMHDKFLVVDGGPTGPTVWTGSYNITDGGTYHDNNNALEFQSAELATVYEQEFQKMFVDRNFGNDSKGTQHPQTQTVHIGNVDITPYFSPSTSAEGGAKKAILDELAQAHKSIQFLAFSYADKDIGQAMLDKAGQGVKVEGVFETSQAHSQYSTWNQMAPQQAHLNGNLDVRMDGNPALMHHKVIIVDDSTLITGSFNFSHNAQSSNDENMIVIHNAPDLVAMYKAEFQRIQSIAPVSSN